MIGYIISTVSLLVVMITMICRATDLRWRVGWKWQLRLIGFMLVGIMPVGIIVSEWYYCEWPSVWRVLLHVGLMFVFVTTPHLPPWWRYISGKDRIDDTN